MDTPPLDAAADAGSAQQQTRHLPLYPLCGACGDKISLNEPVFACKLYHAVSGIVLLCGLSVTANQPPVPSRDELTYSGTRTRPFYYLGRDGASQRAPIDGYRLCYTTESRCIECRDEPMAVTCHTFCIYLFRTGYERFQRDTDEKAMEAKMFGRLWTIGAWQWRLRHDPPAVLADTSNPLTHSQTQRIVLRHFANGSGLPELSKLPAEMGLEIYQWSSRCRFWRYATVMRLGIQSALQREGPLITLPLAQIRSWKRHPFLLDVVSLPFISADFPAEDTFLSSVAMPPFVRITIDCHGISQIERLKERPSACSSTASSKLAFILEDMSEDMQNAEHARLAGLQVEVKVR